MPQYQILKTKIDNYATEKSISQDNAFMNMINELFIDKDDEDILDNIVDGSQDKQIDIIQMDKYPEDDAVIIRIIQVKKEKGFSSDQMIKIRNGVDWIFKKDISDLHVLKNTSLISRIKDVRDALDEYNFNNTTVEVYYATVGSLDDIREGDEILQEKKTLEDNYKNVFADFKVDLIGAKEILQLFQEKANKIKKINCKVNIEYDVNSASIIETYANGIKNVICYVKASELAKVISENISNIFDMNVRKYLLLKGKVNSQIYESCIDEKESKIFSALNNGITIICDEFSVNKIPGNATLSLNNMQIINGCQTSVTLYTAFEKNELKEDTKVLLKVHQTEDKELVEKIIVATNNQNPINPRDLKANTLEQKELQNYFYTVFDLCYQRKRNDFTDIEGNEVKKNNIISNEKVGQAALAALMSLPHKALGSKSSVFTTEHDNIFKKDFLKIVLSYAIHNTIEKYKKSYKTDEQVKAETVKYGTYHITYLVYKMIYKNIKKIDIDYVKKLLQNEVSLEDYIEKATNSIITIISKDGVLQTKIFSYLKTKQSTEDIKNIAI
ncbi:MAG: AIPR family protein [Clostridium butyricum]|nr:AIPR family protein [Clostridium butyricum]MDU4799705.1 AIPR family protein [Clostridium butyricum]